MSREKVLCEELTPTEFRERIARAPVAYLPLGLQSKGFFEILAREAGSSLDKKNSIL